MKLISSVKKSAKHFYHKHPKLTVYGGIGAGVALFSTVIYAATRPKKQSFANLLLASNQPIAYGSTIKGQIELAALTKRLMLMSDVLSSGNLVFVQPGAFKQIFTHQGVRVLDLIPSIFYKDNKFTTDNLASHSWCQTYNAQVVGLGNDWTGWFYNQFYREPPIVKNINGQQVTYAGNAIPSDDPRFVQMAQAAMGAAIDTAMDNADFGRAISDLDKKFGIKLPFALPSDMSSLLMIAVPPGTKDVLARFARDLAAKNNKTLPTVDAYGQPFTQQTATLLQASAGAMMVAGLIEMFESHDSNKNPCIKEVTPELVFEMFMATIGTVMSLAVGPALSAVSLAIKFASTVNKLAELSK